MGKVFVTKSQSTGEINYGIPRTRVADGNFHLHHTPTACHWQSGPVSGD